MALPLRKVIRRARNLGRRLRYRLRDRFIDSHGYPRGADDELARLLPLSIAPAMTDADRAAVAHFLAHRFDLLGSGWTDLGAKIDWHRDFKSGHRWDPCTWYRDIRYGHAPGVDVKVPWELSRMQHLPRLAVAFVHDGDARHPREFAVQVGDWIAANPPRFGVNWACTMDVGIRIANWLSAYDLFRAAGAGFDREFERRLTASVHDHAHHIMNNLEWSEDRRANHYFGNIAGLLFCAAYLPARAESDRWLAFAVRELVAETARQFLPDGGHFEASTSYHRLCGELVAACTMLVDCLPSGRLRTPLPAEHYARIRRAAAFTRDLTGPDGAIVQLGDNDSGRFLTLTQRPCGDHSEWLAWARLAAGEPEPPAQAVPFDRSRATSAPPSHRVSGTHATGPGLTAGLECIAYPDFGAYILRSERLHLVVRCGEVLHDGCGVHAHDDQLAINLYLDGAPVVRDPGTFTYTPWPAQRNAYRSALAHAAPSVRPDPRAGRAPFTPPVTTAGECLAFGPRGFTGTARVPGGTVTRRLVLHDDRIEVTDEYALSAPYAPASDDPLAPAAPVPYSPAYGVQAA